MVQEFAGQGPSYHIGSAQVELLCVSSRPPGVQLCSLRGPQQIAFFVLFSVQLPILHCEKCDSLVASRCLRSKQFQFTCMFMILHRDHLFPLHLKMVCYPGYLGGAVGKNARKFFFFFEFKQPAMYPIPCGYKVDTKSLVGRFVTISGLVLHFPRGCL
jgi:hypothetical protein